MKASKQRQIAVNQANLRVLFGTGGVSAPSPSQQQGLINDSITVTPDDTETTRVSIVLATRIATAAYDMESDLESIEEALSGIDAGVAASIATDGVAPIVLNGVSLTSRLIRNLAERTDASAQPEPIQAVFTSKKDCLYSLQVHIEGAISISEQDDKEDEWAEVSAEVNCAGTDLTGVDTVATGNPPAGKRVTKRIDGETTGTLRQPVSFQFSGTVIGSGGEMTVVTSLWRSAHTNGAVTISTASAVYISNIQVHLSETCPETREPRRETGSGARETGEAVTPPAKKATTKKAKRT